MSKVVCYFIGFFVGIILYIIFHKMIMSKLLDMQGNYLRKRAIKLAEDRSIMLESCPFCGKDYQQIIKDYDGDGNIVYKMECNTEEGGCGASTAWVTLPFDAIVLWNYRTGYIPLEELSELTNKPL